MTSARAILRQFLRNDHGAVTVDWVILTGSVIGIALAVMGAIMSPMGGNVMDKTDTALANLEIQTSFED